MRIPVSALIGILLAVVLIEGCSGGSQTRHAEPIAAPAVSATTVPVAVPTATPTGPPPVSRVKSLPPEGGDIPRPATFNSYAYSYKKDATKTVATFVPTLLPPAEMPGAVRDIILRSYSDKVDAIPRLTGSGTAQSVRIASKTHEYVIVPVTDPGGKIRSLIITQQGD